MNEALIKRFQHKVAVFNTARRDTTIDAKERIIMGIDPGTQVMGYGILKVINNKPQMEAIGC